MWEEYFQAGTLISRSQLQGLKPNKFTYRSLDCSCLLKSLYLGLYRWFAGKNQLLSDTEHQLTNPRTILHSHHRSAVQSVCRQQRQHLPSRCRHCEEPGHAGTRCARRHWPPPPGGEGLPARTRLETHWKETKEPQNAPQTFTNCG